MTLKIPGTKLRRALLRGAPPATHALIILAAGSIGFVIGWSTGQAGLDSAVLAAVLPVILTSVAGGAGAVVVKLTNDQHTRADATGGVDRRPVILASGQRASADAAGVVVRRLVILASVTVIAFSTAFLAGTIVGKYANERGIFDEEIRIREAFVVQRYEYIVRCTRQLVRLNRLRKKAKVSALLAEPPVDLGLEPFTLDQVCIGLARRGSSEHPLVALANEGSDGSTLPVPIETEEKHYRYLETCTLDQADVNRDARASDSAVVTIEQICPGLAATRSPGR